MPNVLSTSRDSNKDILVYSFGAELDQTSLMRDIEKVSRLGEFFPARMSKSMESAYL